MKNYDADGKLIGTDDSRDASAVDAKQTGEQNNANVDANPDSTSNCSLKSFGDIGSCVAEGLAGLMGTIIGSIASVLLIIASFMLWVVGGLFNWVVIKTVFEFGSYFGTSPGMLIAWGILRDIANILLLFGFIFMGLMKIIDSHNEFAGGKTIARLIIFAVLLNFSLFATQIIIDVSNSFASVFTTQAGLSGCSGNDEQGKEACANNGIAGQVIHMAGISSIWSPQGIGDFSNRPEKHAPVYVGLTIFVTITAVVLLAAAIMLIMRAVMLCLLMVLSPIGFAGMAIPPLQEFARSWWKQLLSNAFFAPVYLLLVLISLKIVEGLVGTDNGDSFALALINGGMNAPQVFVMFAIVIAFMVASLVVAKRMGAVGADFATQKAGGAVLGTYGFLGRRTVGAASGVVAERIGKTKWARNSQFGRGVYNTFSKGAAASYSMRGVATAAGKGAHLDFGKVGKDASHGWHGIEEKAKKERTDYAGKLKQTDEEKSAENKLKNQKNSKEAEKKILQRQTEEQTDTLQVEIAAAESAGGPTNEALAKSLKARKALFEKDQKATARRIDREIEDIDRAMKDVDSNVPKREFAKNIEHRGLPWPTADAHANHEAAAEILKSIDKSENQRVIDAIAGLGSKIGGGGAPASGGGGGGGGGAH
ncbi:MAG: hypothetical protein V4681_00475 [Patescibacteria group bacterium]